ncbi:MAG: branched-chain amino acid ABC transporter permease [Trueperaceae bacterium]|nr:branched-chain amino acid ABC transporter permease [Trueperaceae bacterium]
MARAGTPTAFDDVDPKRRVRNVALTLVAIGVGVLVLMFLESLGSSKLSQSLALFAIWGVATVSLNLINGTLGILSLGHHGFMLIGGYTTGLLILDEAARARILTSARSTMTEESLAISVTNMLRGIGLDALTTPDTLWVRFLIAIFLGGLMAAFAGLLVGIPSLRLRGDYLAIVTFGFGEIIRLSASTRLFAEYTNGALGFPGLTSEFGKSVWWTFGILAFTVFVMSKLKFSSYGRAMQAIREDEVAAQAMGINLAYNKVLGFVISAFFAGVAGGLWVSWLGGVRLDFFLFQLTFFFLVAISAGGTGSITGVLLGTALVVFVRQYGDPLEQTYTLQQWLTYAGATLVLMTGLAVLFRSLRRLRPRFHWSAGVLAGAAVLAFVVAAIDPAFLEGTFRGFGMRAIFLSVLLIAIMVFRPEGMIGRAEFSWSGLLGERRSGPTDDERTQDAWLTNPVLNPRGSDADVASGSDAPTAPGRSAARELDVGDERHPRDDSTDDERRG